MTPSLNEPIYALIAARNEAARIGPVLAQLARAGAAGCLVVANGCHDETAAAARRFAARWPQGACRVRVIEVAAALGPDVGRAYAAYLGLRWARQAKGFVFVDGDWAGGFGPSLAAFLDRAQRDPALVAYAQARPDASRLDLALYRAASARLAPHLAQAAVPETPLYVQKDAFDRVSPWWLHQPGLWFARCLLAGVRMVVIPRTVFDPLVRGDRTRSAPQQRAMRETLIGDAAEAAYLLLGRRPERSWRGRQYPGLAGQRRTDLLAALAQTIHFPP
ncbi:glycosyltransferase family 2 protein [Alicyclobacillus shizuokensis]|uniref:glycosyltransferase family 2 protein n=1 Tax=Alicyclobacillus shizuokensis TaxID=392014 RepID=UPI0008346B7C|nr:glycosyltransferase [Alicyclobacillus shizuokensis]MCL6626439.1 glycosyltransferase [Alicyclobacillus shizuokensis]